MTQRLSSAVSTRTSFLLLLDRVSFCISFFFLSRLAEFQLPTGVVQLLLEVVTSSNSLEFIVLEECHNSCISGECYCPLEFFSRFHLDIGKVVHYGNGADIPWFSYHDHSVNMSWVDA